MKIELKCSIESCDHHHDYKLDLNNPVALNGRWRNDESKKGIWPGLLPAAPAINDKCDLWIHGPLNIDLSENFWSIYLDPLSTHKDIASEEGINSIKYCLCENEDVVEKGDRDMILKVVVKNVLDLNDLSKFPMNPNASISILNSMSNSEHYSIRNFTNYSLININVESDLGWIFIILKENMKSKVLIGNTWGFHEDFWVVYNETLSKEQEMKYGIQH